jgi:hypothetical protein
VQLLLLAGVGVGVGHDVVALVTTMRLAGSYLEGKCQLLSAAIAAGALTPSTGLLAEGCELSFGDAPPAQGAAAVAEFWAGCVQWHTCSWLGTHRNSHTA